MRIESGTSPGLHLPPSATHASSSGTVGGGSARVVEQVWQDTRKMGVAIRRGGRIGRRERDQGAIARQRVGEGGGFMGTRRNDRGPKEGRRDEGSAGSPSDEPSVTISVQNPVTVLPCVYIGLGPRDKSEQGKGEKRGKTVGEDSREAIDVGQDDCSDRETGRVVSASRILSCGSVFTPRAVRGSGAALCRGLFSIVGCCVAESMSCL